MSGGVLGAMSGVSVPCTYVVYVAWRDLLWSNCDYGPVYFLYDHGTANASGKNEKEKKVGEKKRLMDD